MKLFYDHNYFSLDYEADIYEDFDDSDQILGNGLEILKEEEAKLPDLRFEALTPSLDIFEEMTTGGNLSIGNNCEMVDGDYATRHFCIREADNLYRCRVCNKTYTHISNFCRHYLTTHKQTKQMYGCPVCQKGFTRKDNMMTHLKTLHRKLDT